MNTLGDFFRKLDFLSFGEKVIFLETGLALWIELDES